MHHLGDSTSRRRPLRGHAAGASGKAGGRGGLCRTAWAGDTGGQGTGSWQSPGRPGEDTGRERRGRKPAPPLAWAQFRQLWVGGCGGIQRPPARGASRRHRGSCSPALWGPGPHLPCFYERVPFTPCLFNVSLGGETPALCTFIPLLTSAS